MQCSRPSSGATKKRFSGNRLEVGPQELPGQQYTLEELSNCGGGNSVCPEQNYNSAINGKSTRNTAEDAHSSSESTDEGADDGLGEEIVAPSSYGCQVSVSESTEDDGNIQKEPTVSKKNRDENGDDEAKEVISPQHLMEMPDVSVTPLSSSINQLFQNMLPGASHSSSIGDVVRQAVKGGYFWNHCEIKKSKPDGHCLLYSLQTAFRSQLSPPVECTPRQLLEIVQEEIGHHLERYLPAIELDELYNDYRMYAEFKVYDTDFGDLVSVIICNALDICLVMVSDDGLKVTIINESAKSAILFLCKSFKHYDGIVPCASSDRIASASSLSTRDEFCVEIVKTLSSGCQASESVKDDPRVHDTSEYTWEEATKDILEEIEVFMKKIRASLPYSLTAEMSVTVVSSSNGEDESRSDTIRQELEKFGEFFTTKK